MRNRLEERLQELKTELESGQKILQDLESRRSNVTTSMLRISGAIQVLEELLEKEKSEAANREPSEAELMARAS